MFADLGQGLCNKIDWIEPLELIPPLAVNSLAYTPRVGTILFTEILVVRSYLTALLPSFLFLLQNSRPNLRHALTEIWEIVVCHTEATLIGRFRIWGTLPDFFREGEGKISHSSTRFSTRFSTGGLTILRRKEFVNLKQQC